MTVTSLWVLRWKREGGRERKDSEARARMGKVASCELMIPFLHHLFQNRLLNQNVFLSFPLSFPLIKLPFVNLDRANPFLVKLRRLQLQGTDEQVVTLSLSQCFHLSFLLYLSRHCVSLFSFFLEIRDMNRSGWIFCDFKLEVSILSFQKLDV